MATDMTLLGSVGPVHEFQVPGLRALRDRGTLKWDGVADGVLAAGVAEMDFGLAPVIEEALLREIRNGALGYPGPAAFSLVAQAFAERTGRRTGWVVDVGLITVVTDVITGVMMALEALTDVGDQVLLVTPAYPPYFRAVEAVGRRVSPAPLLVEEDGGYVFDRDLMEELARTAKAIVLCNPHNPTGRAFTRDELGWIADLAERHDLGVVADEVHGDLVFAPSVHVPYGITAASGGRYVVLTSASKGFNVSGLRCAIAIASSPEVFGALNRQEFYVRPGVSRLGVTACVAAWQHGDPWLVGLLENLAAVRQLVLRRIAEEVPEISCIAPEATYFAWLDWRDSGVEDPSRAVLAAGVSVSDGAWFGPGWEHHTRVNFATSTPNAERIVSALGQAVQSARHRRVS